MGFLQNSLYTASSPSWKPIPWAPWTYCNWSTRNSKVTKQWLTTTSSTDTSFHCPIMCSRSGTSKRFLKRWQLLANPGPWARGKWSRPPDRNLQELKVNDSRILKPSSIIKHLEDQSPLLQSSYWPGSHGGRRDVKLYWNKTTVPRTAQSTHVYVSRPTATRSAQNRGRHGRDSELTTIPTHTGLARVLPLAD